MSRSTSRRSVSGAGQVPGTLQGGSSNSAKLHSPTRVPRGTIQRTPIPSENSCVHTPPWKPAKASTPFTALLISFKSLHDLFWGRDLVYRCPLIQGFRQIKITSPPPPHSSCLELSIFILVSLLTTDPYLCQAFACTFRPSLAEAAPVRSLSACQRCRQNLQWLSITLFCLHPRGHQISLKQNSIFDERRITRQGIFTAPASREWSLPPANNSPEHSPALCLPQTARDSESRC